MNFTEKLLAAKMASNSLLCVGLDPNKLPACLFAGEGDLAGAVYDFCTRIIDATFPYACAFKPNSAFYEALGPEKGLVVLRDVIAYIRACSAKNGRDVIVILDAKRGDIDKTAKKYAESLALFGPDAVTANFYPGLDSLKPYFDAGLGVIPLCVTTNLDAKVFQNVMVDLPAGKMTYYQHIAVVLNDTFGHTGNLALVAGATRPEDIGGIREKVGYELPFLMPGIGKQGGDLAAALGFNGKGPIVINVSGSIGEASSEEDFAEAAGEKAKSFRDQINEARPKAA